MCCLHNGRRSPNRYPLTTPHVRFVTPRKKDMYLSVRGALAVVPLCSAVPVLRLASASTTESGVSPARGSSLTHTHTLHRAAVHVQTQLRFSVQPGNGTKAAQNKICIGGCWGKQTPASQTSPHSMHDHAHGVARTGEQTAHSEHCSVLVPSTPRTQPITVTQLCFTPFFGL